MKEHRTTAPVMPPGAIPCLAAFPACQRTLEFDVFQPGHVNRARRVTVHASGKAINAARTIRRAGGNSVVLGFVGGSTGAFIRDELRHDEQAADLIEVPQPTRYCQTLLDRGAGAATEVVEESAVPDAAAWDALADHFSRQLAAAPVAVVSGTLPKGAPEDFYARLLRSAQAAGVPVILDSHDAALVVALAAHPALVKPNRHELSRTAGRNLETGEEIIAAAQDLIRRGAGAVLVSDGAQPAWLVTPKECWQLHPPRLDPVNPIGCGDALAAGVALSWARGQALSDAVRYGLACAAAHAMASGPVAWNPTTLDEWMRAVQSRRIE